MPGLQLHTTLSARGHCEGAVVLPDGRVDVDAVVAVVAGDDVLGRGEGTLAGVVSDTGSSGVWKHAHMVQPFSVHQYA